MTQPETTLLLFLLAASVALNVVLFAGRLRRRRREDDAVTQDTIDRIKEQSRLLDEAQAKLRDEASKH